MTRRATLALAVAVGCAVPTVTPTQVPESETATPLLNRKIGEPLRVAVVLSGGELLDLSELRGMAIIVEISANWVPSWDEAHRQYSALLDQGGLAVVVVGIDEEPTPLDGLDPRFRMAWDPQGAIPAALNVVELPTIVVLGRDGTIADVFGVFDAERLRDAVRRAQSSGP